MWTLLIYLNACEGGQTIFYPGQNLTTSGSTTVQGDQELDPVVIGVEEGLALFHQHGESCLLHEGTAVVSGVKWVLRADICTSL